MNRLAALLVLALAWPARADEPAPPPATVAEPAAASTPAPAAVGDPLAATPLPPAPPPPRKHRWDLFAGGVVLFGIGYFTNIGLTYGFGFSQPGLSAIPLVGPFAQMANPHQLTGPPIDSGDAMFDKDTEKKVADGNLILYQVSMAWWALSATLQLGGAAMAILGVTLKHKPPGERKKVAWELVPAGAGAALRLTW